MAGINLAGGGGSTWVTTHGGTSQKKEKKKFGGLGREAGGNWGRNSLTTMLLQKLLDFNGGHASGSRRGDSLAVTAVLHIAAGEDAMHACRHVVVGLQIAVGVGIELAGKHLCVGFMTYAEEHRAGGKIRYFICLQVAQLEARDFVQSRIVNILDDRVGEKLNLVIMLRTIQHDFGSTEASPPMNERDLGSKASEEQGFLHCGIAAADHHNFLPRKEEAITGGARRNPVADELVLVGQSQPPRRSAGGDDQGL